MCVISGLYQPTMQVNIHNQCSDFKLVNRGYLSDGTAWNGYPYWKVDTDRMMPLDLQVSLATFKGVLTYGLQRKHSNHRHVYSNIRLFVI
jgi:hypothetical protein